MTPVWLCPLRLREPAGPGVGAGVAAVSAPTGRDIRQRRLLGERADRGRAPPTATSTGTIERMVSESGGHKSLYSDAYYDRDAFDRLYGGETWRAVKDRYDPDHRLTGLYEKAVARA